VPARVDDLRGLPPAWIGVGTLDLFHDEDLAYAERLQAAGVPVTLEVTPGAYHSFDMLVPAAPLAQAFTESWKTALRRAFHPNDSTPAARAEDKGDTP
jgi:acetyl esterase/lipase